MSKHIIFDFDKILYGKGITVEFLEMLRDEIKFDNVEELSEQIISDCATAKEFHKKEWIFINRDLMSEKFEHFWLNKPMVLF